mmetsp:Transcript_107334/g.308897  ORF Transcript_107334/g.308897 Transcript_107334/m.308897 type:complete len:287 (-) Transcript_107334:1757-2617(-)
MSGRAPRVSHQGVHEGDHIHNPTNIGERRLGSHDGQHIHWVEPHVANDEVRATLRYAQRQNIRQLRACGGRIVGRHSQRHQINRGGGANSMGQCHRDVENARAGKAGDPHALAFAVRHRWGRHGGGRHGSASRGEGATYRKRGVQRQRGGRTEWRLGSLFVATLGDPGKLVRFAGAGARLGARGRLRPHLRNCRRSQCDRRPPDSTQAARRCWGHNHGNPNQAAGGLRGWSPNAAPWNLQKNMSGSWGFEHHLSRRKDPRCSGTQGHHNKHNIIAIAGGWVADIDR